MHSLLTVFPTPNDLLAVAPEGLGGYRDRCRAVGDAASMFTIDHRLVPLYQTSGPTYPRGSKEAPAWYSAVAGFAAVDPAFGVAAIVGARRDSGGMSELFTIGVSVIDITSGTNDSRVE
jgi:hypothetical protein